MSYTYVVLAISKRAFEEIKKKLAENGYSHAFHEDKEQGLLIDMHGIALAAAEKEK